MVLKQVAQDESELNQYSRPMMDQHHQILKLTAMEAKSLLAYVRPANWERSYLQRVKLASLADRLPRSNGSHMAIKFEYAEFSAITLIILNTQADDGFCSLLRLLAQKMSASTCPDRALTA